MQVICSANAALSAKNTEAAECLISTEKSRHDLVSVCVSIKEGVRASTEAKLFAAKGVLATVVGA